MINSSYKHADRFMKILTNCLTWQINHIINISDIKQTARSESAELIALVSNTTLTTGVDLQQLASSNNVQQ